MAQTFHVWGLNVRLLPMRRLMTSAFASAALFAAATAMQRSPPIELAAGIAGIPSLQELYTAAGVNKLPIQEFEDMSLVYSRPTKR